MSFTNFPSTTDLTASFRCQLILLGMIEIYPIASFRCLLSLLGIIERYPIASFRCQLNLLLVIGRCPNASCRCRSSHLQTIEKMPIAPFIPIESFSNSSKFGHRVVYSIAPIIRQERVTPQKWNLLRAKAKPLQYMVGKS